MSIDGAYVPMLDVMDDTVTVGDEAFDKHGPGSRERQAGVLSGVFNLSSTILGASCLSIPHATRGIGIVLYVVLLVIIAAMSEFSLRMLTESTRLTGKSTFYSVGHAAMGRTGELLTIVVVLVQQLGACCAYVKIIGDILKPIVANIDNSVASQEWFWQILLAVFVMFPLCMLRRMDSLKYSSLAAVFLVVLFALMLVLDGFYRVHHGLPSSQPVTLVSSSASPALSSIPVICFAFVCAMNVFPVMAELKNPTPRRAAGVTAGSVAVCFFVYVCAGCLGYVAFLDCTQADIIKSYQDMSSALGVDHLLVPKTVVKVLQIGIGLALVFTYPVLAFELRHSLDELLFHGRPFSWLRHAGENVALVVVSVVVAIEVQSLTTIFGYTGATMSCMVVFVLPALFFLCLSPEPYRRSIKKQVATFQLIVGIVLIPLCLTVLIRDSLDTSDDMAECKADAPSFNNVVPDATGFEL